MSDDRDVLAVLFPPDLDRAGEDQGESDARLPDAGQLLAGAEGPALAEARKAFELLVGEVREHLRPARRNQLVLPVRHGLSVAEAVSFVSSPAFSSGRA